MTETHLFSSGPVPVGTLVNIEGKQQRIWHVISQYNDKRNKYTNKYWFQGVRQAFTEKGWEQCL